MRSPIVPRAGAAVGPGLLIATQLYERIGGHRQDAAEPERDLARRLGRGRISVLRSAGFTLVDNREHTELGKRPRVGETWISSCSSAMPAFVRTDDKAIAAHTVAPFALARRRCSSRRGMISTKLQGR